MATDRIDDRLRDKGDRQNAGSSVLGGMTPAPADTCGQSSAYDPTAFLNDLFSYHPPRHDQIPKYQAIRSAAKHLAEIIITNTRDCGDRERAITLLRQSVHMANAAVAMDGRF